MCFIFKQKDFNIKISFTHVKVSNEYTNSYIDYSVLLVVIEKRQYPVPFRTWKSSSSSLIILQGPLVET